MPDKEKGMQGQPCKQQLPIVAQGKIEKRFDRTALRYLKSWFCLDLLIVPRLKLSAVTSCQQDTGLIRSEVKNAAEAIQLALCFAVLEDSLPLLGSSILGYRSRKLFAEVSLDWASLVGHYNAEFLEALRSSEADLPDLFWLSSAESLKSAIPGADASGNSKSKTSCLPI